MGLKRITIGEDWVVVLLGFFIIGSTLCGLVITPPTYSWNNWSSLSTEIFGFQNLKNILFQFVYVYFVALMGAVILGKPVGKMAKAFPIIYLLTMIASLVGDHQGVKVLNMETVIFCLALGLMIGNVFKLPTWLKEPGASEFFVKIGLVILGTNVIFSDILKAGSLGLIQALAVVLAVWYFAYWLCKKLKVDEEMSLMLSSAVSICGVSAAIATSGAIKGDSKKLSLIVSLVLITAVPMMIAMPYLARAMGLTEEVTGAWLGGTIDTTGAVVASGTLVGETALKVSTIVKFSQNVLLGVAAFAISVYWSYSKKSKDVAFEKPGLKVIWNRFPKFVIGFILASLIFSFLLSADTVAAVKAPLKNIQLLWFALAFTTIGLETNFRDLIGVENRKPVVAFLVAQFFNILFTLLIASLLFR
ncbi:MAG TPA: putative sulfate exporter family transporter [Niabella sp.]|mgnify:CR=1 FL=1|nr:putative sulfate exporter family transporter [Niabella sp.]HQW14581.1 putative sulfate exporter family transporter [Niabella sp.]HQX19722.1 putative sulfate exporter family transporter [Niabella sp.]HQX41703.1 putative sulfate exporter family transporter [Niabella sp.]HRB07541.1 putative sulfate exporter family transporter [Niabella sp.]